MQKLINVLAVTSFVVSGAVVGSGVYVYFNRASILDGVKSKIMESVAGSLGGLGGLGVGESLPLGTDDSLPISPTSGLGLPSPSSPF